MAECEEQAVPSRIQAVHQWLGILGEKAHVRSDNGHRREWLATREDRGARRTADACAAAGSTSRNMSTRTGCQHYERRCCCPDWRSVRYPMN